MTIDGIIPKPFALLAVLGTLCLSCACATQSALAETLVERYSHEWDRDDEDDDTIEMRYAAERRMEWQHPDF